MGQATTVDMDGVRVIQGTPSRALTGPTLFLNMWKVTKPAVGELFGVHDVE